MTGSGRHSHTFSWGKAYAFETGIRARVLRERVIWFVSVRWAATVGCAAGTLAAALEVLPAKLDYRYFLVVTLYLAGINVLHSVRGRKILGAVNHRSAVERHLIRQVLGDYLALSVITYASGTLETPILIMFMPHVILVSLFFTRRMSLLLTTLGLLFAALPLLLELSGLVPAISILDLPIKERIIADWRSTLAFIGGLAGCYLFCWYLTSEITSSLKERERQLEHANEALITVDRERTQMTVRAAHELKAPLAAVQMFNHNLLEGYAGELPTPARAIVGRIRDRCERLLSMLADIVHWSNLRSAVLGESDFTAVDLQALVRVATTQTEALAVERQVTVHSLFGEGPPLCVRGSQRHLETLVARLLRGAVTYSDAGQEVLVAVERTPAGIALSVTDHGIGIGVDNLPRIFDEFFRTSEAVRHNPTGNGMSLPIVREIARLHGAAIEVESEKGEGSRFTVVFAPWQPTPVGDNHGQSAHHR